MQATFVYICKNLSMHNKNGKTGKTNFMNIFYLIQHI